MTAGIKCDRCGVFVVGGHGCVTISWNHSFFAVGALKKEHSDKIIENKRVNICRCCSKDVAPVLFGQSFGE